MARVNILIADDEVYALENTAMSVKKAMPDCNILEANGPEEALALASENKISIALLDIEMPGMNGLVLAKRLKDMDGSINIIFVTAYSEYAVDAMKQRASGYLLKPMSTSDFLDEVNNLRNPIENESKKLYIQCFGKFEVYSNGEPLIFTRAAEKEIFAYLIDLKGDGANTDELCGILWPDPDVRAKRRDYFRVLINSLKKTLESYGAGDILVKKRNYFAVKTSMVDCDYYSYLRGDQAAVNKYHGEYMDQYDWADMTVSDLMDG